MEKIIAFIEQELRSCQVTERLDLRIQCKERAFGAALFFLNEHPEYSVQLEDKWDNFYRQKFIDLVIEGR